MRTELERKVRKELKSGKVVEEVKLKLKQMVKSALENTNVFSFRVKDEKIAQEVFRVSGIHFGNL